MQKKMQKMQKRLEELDDTLSLKVILDNRDELTKERKEIFGALSHLKDIESLPNVPTQSQMEKFTEDDLISFLKTHEFSKEEFQKVKRNCPSKMSKKEFDSYTYGDCPWGLKIRLYFNTPGNIKKDFGTKYAANLASEFNLFDIFKHLTMENIDPDLKGYFVVIYAQNFSGAKSRGVHILTHEP